MNNTLRELFNIGDDPVYILILVDAIICVLITTGLLIFSCTKGSQKTDIFFFAINLIIMSGIKTISYCINWVNGGKLLFNSDFLCKLQATLMIIPSISQEFWVTSITITCFQSIVYRKDYDQKSRKKLLILSYLINDGLPILIVLIYHYQDVLGPSGIYCWMKPGLSAIYAIIQYVLKWGCILFNIYLTIRLSQFLISLKVTDGMSEQDKEHIKWLAIRMLSFPLIQLLGASIGTVYRVSRIDVLRIPTVICGSLQGILYPLCFGWNIGIVSCCKDVTPTDDFLEISGDNSISRDSSNISYK